MRKMVIHFGPDSEGPGAGKQDIRNADPAEKRHAEHIPIPEKQLSWRNLLSRKFADRVRKAERVVEGIAIGVALLKKVKGMKRGQKVAVGAVVVAGVAGSAYLKMKSRRGK